MKDLDWTYSGDAGRVGGNESEAPTAFPLEAKLNVLHKLPPDVLEGVDAECTLLTRTGASERTRSGKDSKQDIVGMRNVQLIGEIRTRFPNVGSLDEVILGPSLTDALNRDLRVGIVIGIILTDSDQLGDERGITPRVLPLRCEEVGESFRAETIDVIDGILLTHADDNLGPRGHSRRHYPKVFLGVEASTRDGWDFMTVGRIPSVSHTHVQNLQSFNKITITITFNSHYF